MFGSPLALRLHITYALIYTKCSEANTVDSNLKRQKMIHESKAVASFLRYYFTAVSAVCIISIKLKWHFC